MGVTIGVCLVGEFAVRVATEERGTDLGQQLLSDQLQAGFQGVVDLEITTIHSTLARQ